MEGISDLLRARILTSFLESSNEFLSDGEYIYEG